MTFTHQKATEGKRLVKEGKKKWYMSIWGITLVPFVIPFPMFAAWFLSIGYAGYYCVMVLLQWRSFR